MQQHSSWVERASWLLLIPFWLEAKYICLRTSQFFSLSSSSSIPHQPIMAKHTPQPGECRSWSSQSMVASSNVSLAGTQQQLRHQLVHRNAANAATENMTQDAYLKIIRYIGSSKNKMKHAIGCEYTHIAINVLQLTVLHTGGICREQHDQSIAAWYGKPPWSTKAFPQSVCKIKHHDVVNSGISGDASHDRRPREWTKQS